MSNIQVFDNPDFGQVRVIELNGEPWFCLSDVCRVLDLPQVAKVVQRLDKEVLSRHPLETTGGVQEMYFVNEDGLYDVILDSRKPLAKKFRKWITSEVIPSIRKTGGYVNTINATFLRQVADRMEALENRNQLLTTQVAELQPKANYYDVVLNCKDLVSTSTIAKDYGLSAKSFNQLLKSLGVQFKQGEIWLLYQKYAHQGWTSTKTHVCYDGFGNEYSKVHTYWTQKGRLGLYELLKGKNYLS